MTRAWAAAQAALTRSNKSSWADPLRVVDRVDQPGQGNEQTLEVSRRRLTRLEHMYSLPGDLIVDKIQSRFLARNSPIRPLKRHRWSSRKSSNPSRGIMNRSNAVRQRQGHVLAPPAAAP